MAYYTDLLNKLGFKATLKVIADSVYFQTIGNQSLNAQTGLRRLVAGLPEPVGLLPAAVEGRHPGDEQRELRQRQRPEDREPAGQAAAQFRPRSWPASTAQWQALDKYVAEQAYTVPYGYDDGTEVHVEPGRLRRTRSSIR